MEAAKPRGGTVLLTMVSSTTAGHFLVHPPQLFKTSIWRICTTSFLQEECFWGIFGKALI